MHKVYKFICSDSKRAHNGKTGFLFYIGWKEHIYNAKNGTWDFGYATSILNNNHNSAKKLQKNKFWKELIRELNRSTIAMGNDEMHEIHS